VSQRATLFSGTIDSNIRYGNELSSLPEIERAAATAQAMEFVEQVEQRFDHPIAQGGTNVSGGQKQRLSIARAIVRDPDIYIFDDSFSALDFRTDARLRAALSAETQQRTVLIVAQRVSTIMAADKIVVLDNGRIVGQGRHAELLRSCPVYQEIAASQLSTAELASAGAGMGEMPTTPNGRRRDLP
jgi:ATP-binding cassette subfamily B protein